MINVSIISSSGAYFIKPCAIGRVRQNSTVLAWLTCVINLLEKEQRLFLWFATNFMSSRGGSHFPRILLTPGLGIHYCNGLASLSPKFSLLRSAIACLRGARSHRGCPANCGALDLALAEGQVCDHAN